MRGGSFFACSGFNFVVEIPAGPGKWVWNKRELAVTIVTHGSTNKTHSDGAPPLGGGGQWRARLAWLSRTSMSYREQSYHGDPELPADASTVIESMLAGEPSAN